MKKIVAVILSVACVMIFTGSASAYQTKYYAGFSFLYALENLDEQQTRDKFTGPLSFDGFDDSWGVQLKAGYVVNKLLCVEAMYEFVDAFEIDSNGVSDELDVMNVMVNAKLTCPAFDTWVPYVTGGLGVMSANEEIRYAGVENDTRENGLSARGGAGVDYYMTDEFSIGLEGAYVTGFGNVDHVRFTELLLGVSYHF